MDTTQLLISAGVLGGLAGSAVTAIAQSIFNKKEREFNLGKEEYYLLQGKAEIIFSYMHKYEAILSRMFTELETHIFDFKKLSDKNEIMETYHEEIYKTMHVYFWDLTDEYNDFAKSLGKLMDIYFDVFEKGKLEKSDIEKVKDREKDFRNLQYEFTKKITIKLEEKRKSLINI